MPLPMYTIGKRGAACRSLAGQALSGTLSSPQWSTLVKLRTINLGNNSIRGALPNLTLLVNLRSL